MDAIVSTTWKAKMMWNYLDMTVYRHPLFFFSYMAVSYQYLNWPTISPIRIATPRRIVNHHVRLSTRKRALDNLVALSYDICQILSGISVWEYNEFLDNSTFTFPRLPNYISTRDILLSVSIVVQNYGIIILVNQFTNKQLGTHLPHKTFCEHTSIFELIYVHLPH